MFEIIEGVVIVGIICMQSYIAYKLWFTITEYCNIFNIDSLPSTEKRYIVKHLFESVDSSNVSDVISNSLRESEIEEIDVDLVEITYLQDKEHSRILSTIIKYINVYLIKNKGATVDFHIIKDIVEKHTQTTETQIENRIPAPLYLGLAATMLGIIIGLFNVNFGKGEIEVADIQPLIDGVKWAMSASVIGLIITTIFSIKINKDAQIEVDEEKNEFLSKLQSELMPKMTKGKLPEVSILSNKLDSFARTTLNAVSQLDNIVETSRITVSQEYELLSAVRAMDIKKVTSANVKVFSKLDEMMSSFDNFARYYEELDKSMVGTSELLSNLKQFISNSQNVNIILQEIKENIKLSNEASEFFSKHIQSFETYGNSVNEAIAKSDSVFREAIAQLTTATEAQIESFNILISEYDTKLTNAFTHSIDKFTEAMDEQVRRTEQAFEAGRPNFEKLAKLDKLESIEERLIKIETKLPNVIMSGNKDVINELIEINSSINSQSQNSIFNQKITDKKFSGKRSSFLRTSMNYLIVTLKVGMYITITTYGIILALQFFKIL